MLSQEVWVNLRLCMPKKLQETLVLLPLALHSESQGMRKEAGEGGQSGSEERDF